MIKSNRVVAEVVTHNPSTAVEIRLPSVAVPRPDDSAASARLGAGAPPTGFEPVLPA